MTNQPPYDIEPIHITDRSIQLDATVNITVTEQTETVELSTAGDAPVGDTFNVYDISITVDSILANDDSTNHNFRVTDNDFTGLLAILKRDTLEKRIDTYVDQALETHRSQPSEGSSGNSSGDPSTELRSRLVRTLKQ